MATLPAQTGYQIPKPIKDLDCQTLLSKPCVTKSGFLRKKPSQSFIKGLLTGHKRWPHKFVVLADGCFYVFPSEVAPKCERASSLFGYDPAVAEPPQSAVGNCPWNFKIINNLEEREKVFCFCASSEESMNQWISCFTKEIEIANSIFTNGWLSGSNGNQSRVPQISQLSEHDKRKIRDSVRMPNEIVNEDGVDEIEYELMDDCNVRGSVSSASSSSSATDIIDTPISPEVVSLSQRNRELPPIPARSDSPRVTPGLPAARKSPPETPSAKFGPQLKVAERIVPKPPDNNSGTAANDQGTVSKAGEKAPPQRPNAITLAAPASRPQPSPPTKPNRMPKPSKMSSVSAPDSEYMDCIPKSSNSDAATTAATDLGLVAQERVSAQPCVPQKPATTAIPVKPKLSISSVTPLPPPPKPARPSLPISPDTSPSPSNQDVPLHKRSVPPVPSQSTSLYKSHVDCMDDSETGYELHLKQAESRTTQHSIITDAECVEDPIVGAAFCTKDVEQCTEIMKHIAEEGVYMIRNSSKKDEKTIVIKTFDPREFSVKYTLEKTQDNHYTIGTKSPKFGSVAELIRFYHNNSLPGRSTSLTKAFSDVLRNS